MPRNSSTVKPTTSKKRKSQTVESNEEIDESTTNNKRKNRAEESDERKEKTKRSRRSNREDEKVEVICAKLQIEDNKHPFHYANGSTEVYTLDDIMGYNEKEIKKEDVLISFIFYIFS